MATTGRTSAVRKVNVYAKNVVSGTSYRKIFGLHKGLVLTVSDIKKCIEAGADVYDVKTHIKLTLENYINITNGIIPHENSKVVESSKWEAKPKREGKAVIVPGNGITLNVGDEDKEADICEDGKFISKNSREKSSDDKKKGEE